MNVNGIFVRSIIGATALAGVVAVYALFPGAKDTTVGTSDASPTKAPPSSSDRIVESENQVHVTPSEPASPGPDLIERGKSLALDDLAAAFALVDKEADPTGRARVRIQLAKEILLRDPKSFSAVLKFIPPRDRKSVLRFWASPATQKDARAALLAIESQLSGEMKTAALSAAIDQLAEQGNFATAIAKQREMPKSAEGRMSLYTIARELSRADFPAFLSWTDSLPEDEVDAVVRTARDVLQERQDDVALQTLLPRITNPAERWGAIQGIVAAQSKRGDTVEMDRFLTTLDPVEREIGQGTALINAGTIPVEAAIEQAIAFKSRHAAGFTIGGLIRRESEIDLQKAAALVARVPEPAEEAATQALVNVWYAHDSVQLSEWINRLPSGTLRDKSLKYLAYTVMRTDRALAREVAETIGDPTLRSQMLATIAR